MWKANDLMTKKSKTREREVQSGGPFPPTASYTAKHAAPHAVPAAECSSSSLTPPERSSQLFLQTQICFCLHIYVYVQLNLLFTSDIFCGDGIND